MKLTLFYSKLEIETKIARSNEEIARKMDELLHFKCLLTKTIKERDEFQFKCQRLVSENLILQQELRNFEANLSSFTRVPHISYIEYDPIVSSLVHNGNFIRTQLSDQIPLLSLSPSSHIIDNVVLTSELPEKGKFLQAMMETGPLLQTLLLVGHLPWWRNPPPQLNSTEIPQATTPLSFMRVNDGGQFISKKRVIELTSEVQRYNFPTINTKYHKVVR